MPTINILQEDLVDRLLLEWRRERTDLDPAAMAIVGRMIHLGHRFEASAAKALSPLGLSYTELDVLATLRRSGKPYTLTPGQLQTSVLLTSGAMTACLRRLEQAGLILRSAAEHDKRSISATLTSDGRKLVDRAIKVRFQEAARHIEGLTSRECDTLASLLKRLMLRREQD